MNMLTNHVRHSTYGYSTYSITSQHATSFKRAVSPETIRFRVKYVERDVSILEEKRESGARRNQFLGYFFERCSIKHPVFKLEPYNNVAPGTTPRSSSSFP